MVKATGINMFELSLSLFLSHMLSSFFKIQLIVELNIHIFSFAGLQAFEIMAIAAVGNNLITYVMNEMHFSLSKSANIVTNFVGTVFILALLGGYLSDSYLGCFWTMLIFGFVELSVRPPFFFIPLFVSLASLSILQQFLFSSRKRDKLYILFENVSYPHDNFL